MVNWFFKFISSKDLKSSIFLLVCTWYLNPLMEPFPGDRERILKVNLKIEINGSWFLNNEKYG